MGLVANAGRPVKNHECSPMSSALFHVKHAENISNTVPSIPLTELLFADTEIPEDHVQNVLDIDASGELAQ
jgi:hypothetical protein